MSFVILRIGKDLILYYWDYGVYSPKSATIATPPMPKYPDYQIRE